MPFKRSTVFIILFVLLFGVSGSASATSNISVSNVTAWCNAVRFTWATEFTSVVWFRVVDGAGDVVGGPKQVQTDYESDTGTLTIHLDAPQPEGTLLTLQYNFGGVFWTPLITLQGCSGELGSSESASDGAEPPPPMYQPMGGEGARLSLFIFDEDNGSNNPVLIFYRIDEESMGHLLFFIPSSSLAELPDNPEEPITIFESEDGLYGFYKLPSGEYQINVGPDNEGKVHVVTFTGVPPENVRGHTFSIFDLLGLLRMG